MAEGNIHCQTEQTSDEVFDFECGPCKFDGNILKAIGFCSDCSDYLCDDCFRIHRKPVPSRHHILLDANEMPKDKTTVKTKDVGTVRCEKHEGDLIEYYCSNHECLGCSICMTLDHRSCEKVDHIPKIVDGLYTTQEYVDYKHSIDAVVKKTNSNAVELDRSSTEAERIYVSTKEQIKKHRKDLISCIDNLEKKLENDISILNENNIFKLKQATDANEELENEIKLLGDEINQQEDHSKMIDSFVTMKKIRCKIATFNDKADSVITHAEIDKYSLQTKPIQVLGKIVKALKLPVKKATKPMKINKNQLTVQNCVICIDKVTDPATLPCGHTFCKGCIEQQFKHKKACPICGAVYGITTGDQPQGTMDVTTNRYASCAGYEKYGRINIQYHFPDGRQQSNHPSPRQYYKGITRFAYLPDNHEGRQICEMLQVAFDRKLVFTFGRSRTTGQEDVITWNDIHHKTDHQPNAQFGYPDSTYFNIVKDELAAKGVTEKDIAIK